jgi:hypothetical protein
MIAKPDDQVLEYCIYQMRIARATREVLNFFGFYEIWREKQ